MRLANQRIRPLAGSLLVGILVLALSPLTLLASPDKIPGTTASSGGGLVFHTSWGASGEGDGEFNTPRNVAVDGNHVYVVDSYNGRIQKFDTEGSYISQFGEIGEEDGQLHDPHDIAIDSGGNIYVADFLNHRIQKFDTEGNYISQFGGYGTGDGEFTHPAGIAIGDGDTVYVSDTGNSRIQTFDSDGTYLFQFGQGSDGDGLSSPRGIAINNFGWLFVADSGNNRIQAFTAEGDWLYPFGGGRLMNPTDIVYDRNSSSYGDFYVMDSGNHRVQKFNAEGIYVSQFGGAGSAKGQFDNPRGIAVDSDGNVYVADTINNRIQKFGAPHNLGFMTTADGSDIELTLPEGNHITSISSLKTPALDSGHSYPLDLAEFIFETAVGGTVEVNLMFETNLNAADVSPRKYHSGTKTYTDIPGATVTEATVNDRPALLLTYEITDGGPLDEDGVANGTVVDPVGLAAKNDSPDTVLSGDSSGAPGVPNTGLAPKNILTYGGAVVIGMGLLLSQAGFIRRFVYGIFKESA